MQICTNIFGCSRARMAQIPQDVDHIKATAVRGARNPTQHIHRLLAYLGEWQILTLSQHLTRFLVPRMIATCPCVSRRLRQHDASLRPLRPSFAFGSLTSLRTIDCKDACSPCGLRHRQHMTISILHHARDRGTPTIITCRVTLLGRGLLEGQCLCLSHPSR
jgi:hypothetical protein